MVVQNLIKLSAAVHELSCCQNDHAENNTTVALVGSAN